VNWVDHLFRGIDRCEMDLLETVKGPFRESANHSSGFTRFENVFVHGDDEDLSEGTFRLALGDFGTLR